MTRTALITGAASGIGAAIAARLAAGGVAVVLTDIDETVVEVAERLGGIGMIIDNTDAESVARIADLETLDIVVNSAAVPAETTPDSGEVATIVARTLDVNVTGITRVIGAALPLLRRSRTARILNIGSVQGIAAASGGVAYATSKGAVHTLTKALAVDLAPDGILVNALAPGFVDTPMARLADGSSEYDTEWFRSIYLRHGRIPLRRPAQPEEIAAAAEFLVAADNTYITGTVLPVDGGLLATF